MKKIKNSIMVTSKLLYTFIYFYIMHLILLYRNSNDKQSVKVEQNEILYENDSGLKNDFAETLSYNTFY